MPVMVITSQVQQPKGTTISYPAVAKWHDFGIFPSVEQNAKTAMWSNCEPFIAGLRDRGLDVS